MKKNTIVSCLLLCATLSLFLIRPSSAAVVNGGFETGDFTGWTVETTNDYTGIMGTAYAKSSAPSAHAFIVTPGTDPNVPVNTVHDGSYAARIGYTYNEFVSELGGSQSPDQIHWQTTITQTATVPPAPATFLTFWYAVGAMGNHPQGQAAGFILTVVAGSTTVFQTGNEAYTSPSYAPGWTWIGGLAYYPWTLVSVDLSAYSGQSLTITLLVHGCSQTAHTAWAYLDNINIDLPRVVVSSTATSIVTSATTVTGSTATTITLGASTTRYTSYSTTTAAGTITESATDIELVTVFLQIFEQFAREVPIPYHVGGEVFSASKLSILAPYLIGIFSIVAVASIVAKRKFT